MVQVDFLPDFGLLSCYWPDSEELSQQLKELILQKETEIEGIQVSNQGGWHSPLGLDTWEGEGECVQVVLSRIDSALHEMAKYVEMEDGYVNHGTWANINRKGQLNHAHVHRHAWAGVYYVDPGEHDSGEIGIVKGALPKGWSIDQASATSTETIHIVKPKAGLLLMFPGPQMHFVRKYEGDDERISIAFNFKTPDTTSVFIKNK